MDKSKNQIEKRKISYSIEDVMRIKKAIEETAWKCLKDSIIEDIPYFSELLKINIDLSELLTFYLKDFELTYKDHKNPVFESIEFDFDTSNL